MSKGTVYEKIELPKISKKSTFELELEIIENDIIGFDKEGYLNYN